MSGITVDCPCGEEVEVEVTAHTDHHPYGSTTAAEHSIEVDGAECSKCQRDLTETAIEQALDEEESY